MSPAMEKALKKFEDLGKSGIIDRSGRMIVKGEPIKSVDGSTWLRLILAGKIEVRFGMFYLIGGIC